MAADRRLATPIPAAACAFGDFDNDGDVDILIMNLNEPPSLLRNDVAGGGHWLKVKLVGMKSNRSAIGATVIATYGGRKQAQAVTAQVELLVGKRPPAPLRPGRVAVGGSGNPVAEWRRESVKGGFRGPIGHDSRRRGRGESRSLSPRRGAREALMRAALAAAIVLLLRTLERWPARLAPTPHRTSAKRCG